MRKTHLNLRVNGAEVRGLPAHNAAVLLWSVRSAAVYKGPHALLLRHCDLHEASLSCVTVRFYTETRTLNREHELAQRPFDMITTFAGSKSASDGGSISKGWHSCPILRRVSAVISR